MSETAIPGRDPAVVTKFIERFASTMVEAGMPRMPARVFAALLAADSGRLTTAELAETLQISPAAISGAVRYLTQTRLIGREREPGSRRDHFVVWDDNWYEASMRRDQFLTSWADCLREGVDILGRDTPAGVRVAESLAFIEFLHEEMPGMLARWRERRDELRAAAGRRAS
ncbi:MAG TPA: MarR family transcriptional regulator [Streptosporangiaceae bacterium]|nr:MarR family transcriptional regulator [Streptosporangiaceae bacterium]